VQFFKLSLAIIAALFSIVSAAYDNVTATGYDTNQGLKSVWLSAAASCGHDNYMTHVFKGPTEGFVVSKVIYNAEDDTQGYIGYLPSDKSIYVVFRGSESIENWKTNLNAFKVPYTSWSDCNCQVHKGFYAAEQKVISEVIKEFRPCRRPTLGMW